MSAAAVSRCPAVPRPPGDEILAGQIGQTLDAGIGAHDPVHRDARDREQGAQRVIAALARKGRLAVARIAQQPGRRREDEVAGTSRRLLDVLHRALAFLDGRRELARARRLQRLAELHHHQVVGRARRRGFQRHPRLRRCGKGEGDRDDARGEAGKQTAHRCTPARGWTEVRPRSAAASSFRHHADGGAPGTRRAPRDQRLLRAKATRPRPSNEIVAGAGTSAGASPIAARR